MPEQTTLEDEIKTLKDRLTALEAKPANALTPEQISEALNGHPLIADFRSFLDRWGHKA
jgi:hypothetical protein